MPAPDFLDTNVLVYAYGASHAGKQRVAQNLVRKALGGEIVTSVQVLAEFGATLLHKVSPAVDAEDVTAILDALNPIRTIAASPELVRRAVEVRAEYGLYFYDGMIVAAATSPSSPIS